MKKGRILLAGIACAALMAVGFLSARLLEKEPKVEVSASSIAEQLSACSELASARLDYRGILKYSEGTIPLFNKKAFSMIYDAEIKAGIDLSQAKITVKDNEIHIALPESKILDIQINPDTLEFYDQQFALFNWTDKTDTAKAIQYAMQDAAAKADQTELTEEALTQTKTLIEALLAPLTETDGKLFQIVFE